MFDYLIVGGGSAGCVLAARLSENPDITVALLEAGPLDTNVLIRCPAALAVMAQTGQASWQADCVPQPGLNGRQSHSPSGKVLGGSSAINAMVYIRGQRQDYDHWAAQGNAGWSYDELLPYFQRAEHNGRGGDAFHGSAGPLHVIDPRSPNRYSSAFVQAAEQAGHAHNPDFNAAVQEGVGLYQLTQKEGERCSASQAYLTPSLTRPNLLLFTGAHTTRVLLAHKRAIGVEFQHEGQVKQLKARREVLLCLGALHSPQILMLSGIGAHAHLLEMGIATRHELPGVGQNLHDHVNLSLVVDAPRAQDLFGFSLTGIGHLIKGIVDWRGHHSGILCSNFAEAGAFIKSQPLEDTPDLQLSFVIRKLINQGRSIAFGHGFSCQLSLLRPRSRGSLKLASKDPLDSPLIDLDFLGERDDMERLLRGVKLARRILAQPALATLQGREQTASAHAQSDIEIERFIRDHADSGCHPAGSCRMGQGLLDVVDAQLRVRGLQGLRVVDASIMPSVVSGNTNAPVIMIAEKAADMIKADSLNNFDKIRP